MATNVRTTTREALTVGATLAASEADQTTTVVRGADVVAFDATASGRAIAGDDDTVEVDFPATTCVLAIKRDAPPALVAFDTVERARETTDVEAAVVVAFATEA